MRCPDLRIHFEADVRLFICSLSYLAGCNTQACAFRDSFPDFSEHGVNVYDLFPPDLMHEFELGVWKGTFAHLLRLLAAQGSSALAEFNRRCIFNVTPLYAGNFGRSHAYIFHDRMRDMPTFGREKIRKFWSDVSSRKKLAARDYEDFLIVSPPRTSPSTCCMADPFNPYSVSFPRSRACYH